MRIKASNVEGDWFTEGKEYGVTPVYMVIIDDNGIASMIHPKPFDHLNEYADWELLEEA
jgi:hypothetical protein